MVDYTKDTGTGRGIGLYIAGGLVVLVLLYALFAGGGAPTTLDADGLAAPEATQTTPAVPDEAPAVVSE